MPSSSDVETAAATLKTVVSAEATVEQKQQQEKDAVGSSTTTDTAATTTTTNSEGTKKKDKKKKSSGDGDDDDQSVIVPTKGHDWSLNYESESEKRFWWNKTYSLSIWECNIDLEVDGEVVEIDPKTQRAVNDDIVKNATDFDVWRAFIKYQINAVYKVCPICKQPEQNVDCKICCYCSATVHVDGCCIPAERENIIWKPSNKGFEQYMCICNDCEDLKDAKVRPFTYEPDNARRACIRALAAAKEYPEELRQQLLQLRDRLNEMYGHDGSNSPNVSKEEDMQHLDRVQTIVASYFQPGDSASYLTKQPIDSKCGGLGVVAVKDIPRFTIIGVYPGYEDPLSGEQAKLGRPGPKYSLVDLNCADFYNHVFVEMGKTFTPFINEPNLQEKSNVAWIQENIRPEGRLSVMTVRDIKAGEELLIGYGPLYPRTYPYTYDAYAYHEVETHKNCFALWQWSSLEEKDATFVCYCGFDPETKKYSYWETEEEMHARKAREAREKGEDVGREGKPPKRRGKA